MMIVTCEDIIVIIGTHQCYLPYLPCYQRILNYILYHCTSYVASKATYNPTLPRASYAGGFPKC